MKSYDELKYQIDGIGFTVKVPDKSEFFLVRIFFYQNILMILLQNRLGTIRVLM